MVPPEIAEDTGAYPEGLNPRGHAYA